MTTKRVDAARRFAVGDRVRFLWGRTEMIGLVVEDRGDLGVDREQIVRVRVEPTRDVEMRVSRLKLVESNAVGLLYKKGSVRVVLDLFSAAAHYPKPGLRIEGADVDLPDLEPTSPVNAKVVKQILGVEKVGEENNEPIACGIVGYLYRECKNAWDPVTKEFAERFIGSHNVEIINDPRIRLFGE